MNVRVARALPRPTARKEAAYKSYSFPGPSLGLVAMNNLAVAVPGSAAVLENIFPTATGGIMRRGKQSYAQLGDGNKPTLSMFSYSIGEAREFFAASDDTIYNITNVPSPENVTLVTEAGFGIEDHEGNTFGVSSTEGLEVFEGALGGNWSVVQFSTDGGTFLIGVNGASNGFVYDGTYFYPQMDGGVHTLAFDGGTVEFTEGETVTGGTSAATGTILKIIPDDPENPEVSGVLWLTVIAGGPFEDNEAITDGEGGAAVADGAEVAVPGTDVSFKDDPGLTTADLAYVWAHKRRLWFIERDSLTAWYLPVDSIGGELTAFPIGAEFGKGGHLVFGTTWSQESGDGLNSMCVFVTSEGEAAVYQGDDPDDAETWGQVGVYQTGKPMGAHAHVRIGGDLAMASDVAFVPLSEALRREYSQLGSNSLSAPIEALWPQEVESRKASPWHCEFWTANRMIVVGLPTVNQQPPAMLVMNSRTGKWAKFTNWSSTCLHVFNDRLFCGDDEGMVFELNVTGADRGEPYTATYIPSFDQMGEVGYKIVHLARPVIRSDHRIREKTTVHVEYDETIPIPPPASVPTPVSQWGSVTWGNFVWGASLSPIVQQPWRDQRGAGEVIAVGVQVTSGSNIPLDAEIVRIDALFTVGSPLF